MSTREIRQPTAEHPIAITPTTGRVQVRVNGELVADTRAALGLAESTYPVVQYIPISDVDPAVLTATGTQTYCPYKGDASYFSVTAAGTTVEDAIWTYNEPYPAVAAIAGRVAFYPDKADISIDPD
ncbi:DUF427 domain-containing protein [Mycolicibacterium sarraceniae]|uniref:DUF427 domain-containing protein n=1 Tax=Mycolicibacterium sarraceniae TaxID=1534348 RepID=A0A7I7SPX9_9MYCO|nr:DUF427 domain-containing protein [Mycolicibacterium sarraceniae]BBY58620.1 hypothetical protein MSAR_17560 [Mycolicibacterium sarraceniae]